MTIYELIKKKGTEIFTINKDIVICEALKMLNNKHIGALMVMHDNKVVGIMTERDILKHLLHSKGHIKGSKIHEIMTPAGKFTRAAKKDSIQSVMKLMTKMKVRHMPVFDEEKLIGMVSIGDMVKVMLDLSETENEQLRDYVTGKYI